MNLNSQITLFYSTTFNFMYTSWCYFAYINVSGLPNEERFRLLTGETPQTLYYGKLITCVVTGFAYKKPTREELDSANPTRNDETNLWKCPFCLLDTFPDLSEVRFFPVYVHLAGKNCNGWKLLYYNIPVTLQNISVLHGFN